MSWKRKSKNRGVLILIALFIIIVESCSIFIRGTISINDLISGVCLGMFLAIEIMLLTAYFFERRRSREEEKVKNE